MNLWEEAARLQHFIRRETGLSASAGIFIMPDGITRYRIDKLDGHFAMSFRICDSCCMQRDYHNLNCYMCQNIRYRYYYTKEEILEDVRFLMMLHSET